MKSVFVLLALAGSVVLSSVLLNSCKKNDRFYGTPLPFEVPPHFPQPAYSFSDHPLTKEGVELGRKLFYEGRLSIDGNFPCASCHQQAAGFTLQDHDLGHGYNGSHTRRNPTALANLAWFTEYYHDGSTKSLEKISYDHITSPTEMAETMEGVVAKLLPDTAYRRLFAAAFGDSRVTSNRILTSLSQFVITLVTSNAKFDRVQRNEEAFTAQEQRGYTLFSANCVSCHTPPLFTNFSYRNIGLPLNPFLNDFGRMEVTGKKADSLKFRVPSLRNVSVTGTYAHDGRIISVKSMINHYRSGVKQGPTLDPLVAGGLSLTNAQVDDVAAFLKTLTDSSYLTNPRFGPL